MNPRFFKRIPGLVLTGALFLGAVSALSSAWAAGPGFRIIQGGRLSTRGSKAAIPDELFGRVEMDALGKGKWKLIPFAEGRRNLDSSIWSRLEAGAELGFRPLSWFYLGNGLQQAWIKPGQDHPEWEIRALFSVPLPWGGRLKKMALYAFGEYSYDLEGRRGIRNEIGAGFLIPLPIERFSLTLGWRHVDLIHGADMDQFEGTLQAEF